MERTKQTKERKALTFWLLALIIYFVLTQVVFFSGVGGPIRLNYLFLFILLMVVSRAERADQYHWAWFSLTDLAVGQAKPWHLPGSGSSLLMAFLPIGPRADGACRFATNGGLCRMQGGRPPNFGPI